MAYSTSDKLNYLINLKLDIDENASTQKITSWFNRVKVIEEAFKSLGKEIPKSMEKVDLSKYIQNSINQLNELGKSQATTFTSMKNGIIEVNRAFGDFLKAKTTIDKDGMKPYTVSKSIAGKTVSPFDSMSVSGAIAEQNRVYLKEVEGLGDDVQKSILKLGIQDALSKSNSQLSKFLMNNIDQIENYVQKSTIAYDSDGKAISSWVDLKVGEFQKLSLSMKYFTEQIETKSGQKESRIGVRTSQKLTTDTEGALSSLRKSMEESYQIERKINEESLKGNIEQVNVYKQQKQAIDSVVESKKKSYLSIASDKGDNGQEQIKAIEEEIKLRRDLDSAIEKDNQKRKEQQSVVSSIESSLKEYASVLSNTQKIEASGSDTYGAKLQYNKTRMTELTNALSQYGQGIVSIDKKTGEAVIDQNKLSQAFGKNQEAINRVNQAVKEYNNEIGKQKAEKSHIEDTAKVEAAISKLKELTNARKTLISLQSKGADTKNIQKATQEVNNLEKDLKKLTSEVLANGKQVDKTTDYTREFAKAEKELDEYTRRSAEGARQHTSSLGKLFGSFGQVISNVVKYNAAQIGLNQTIHKTVTVMKELDAELTNIRMVTGLSETGARDMLNTYSDMAQQLGSTTQQVAQGSIEWLRQGKTVEETSQLLTASTMLSKLGMMESSEATEKLTAALNGYKLSADDAIGVVDKLVNIDLIAATSSEELATSLQYVSSMAGAAGVSFDKMISLIAVGSETTRLSAESMGNAWKSVLSRMQQVKAGVDVDDMGEPLNNVEKVLNRFNIELRDTQGNFRDMESVLDEVGKSWDIFNDVEQAQIATAIAGTYQRNTFISVMENYDKVLKYTTESQNAAGTSAEKYTAYINSMEAKINILSATWEKFVNNLNQKGNFNKIIDGLSNLINVLDKLLNEWNLLNGLAIPVIFGVISSMVSSKVISGLSILRGEFSKLGASISSTGSIVKGFASYISNATQGMSLLSGAIGIGITLFSMITAAVEEYNRKIIESINLGADNARAYKDQNENIESLIDEYKELNQKLEENAGNVEETDRIKSELLEVQNQLNTLYEEENEKLQLVNGSYEEQIDIIRRLNKEQAGKFLQENTSSYSNAEKLLSKKEGYYFEVDKNAVDEFNKAFNDVNFESVSEGAGTLIYQVKFNNDEAEEELRNLFERVQQFEEDTGIEVENTITQISKHISDVVNDEAIQNAKVLREQYQMATVAQDDQIYEKYSNLSDIIKEYNEALLSGDAQKIAEVKKKLDEATDSAKDLMQSGSGVDIAFNNLLDTIDKNKEKYEEFKNSIPSGEIDELKQELSDFTFDELRAGGIEAFDDLVEEADKYGLTLEHVIQILEELGVISEDNLVSWEKLGIAINQTLSEMESNDTPFEGFNSAFDEALDNFSSNLAEIETGYNSLLDAVEEFNEQGYISASTFKSLSDNNLLQYLQLTENGLYANTDALLDSSEAIRENAIQTIKLNALKQIEQIVTQGVTDEQLMASQASYDMGTALSALETYLDDVTVKGLSAAAAFDAFHNSLRGAGYETDLSPYKKQIQGVLDSTAQYISFVDDLGMGLSKVTRTTNGASSASGGLNDATKELTDSLKEQQEQLENEKKAIEDLIEAFIKMFKQQLEDEKKLLEEKKDAADEEYEIIEKNLEEEEKLKDRYFEDEKKRLEELQEQDEKYYEDRMDALENELDAYQKKIEKQKELLEAKKEEQDYEKELEEKVKSVAEIEAELAALQFDDSIEAQKKKIELAEELAEKQGELDDFQSDHEYDLQQDALDKELERFEELQEAKKQALEEEQEQMEEFWEEKLEKLEEEQTIWERDFEDRKDLQEELHDKTIKDLEEQIKVIEDKIDDEKQLRLDALEAIDTKNEELYRKLIEWNFAYGTGVAEDITSAWNTAQGALEKYKGVCDNTQEILEYLTKETGNIENKLKDVESAANGASGAIGGMANNTTKANEEAAKLREEVERLEEELYYANVEIGDMYEGLKKINDISPGNHTWYNPGNNTTISKNHTGTDYVTPSDDDRKISKAMGLKSDEVLRILKVGEAVIPKNENLQRLKEDSSIVNQNIVNRTKELSRNSQSYSTNNNSITSISIGDTIIQGNADSSIIPELDKYKKSIVNEVFYKINKHTTLSGFRNSRNFV